jgi:hypothetical protein
MSKTPLRAERAPLLGEHSDAVYRGLLGYSEARLALLRGSGVV